MEVDTTLSIGWIIGFVAASGGQLLGFVIWIVRLQGRVDIAKEKLDEHTILIKENTNKDESTQKDMTDKLQHLTRKLDKMEIVLEMIAKHLKIDVPKFSP